jgi:hypothetical protein
MLHLELPYHEGDIYDLLLGKINEADQPSVSRESAPAP